MVRHNNYKEDQYAQEFGIKVLDQLTSVEARILPPPMVVILVKTIFTCRKLHILIFHFFLFQLKYHDSGRDKTCNPKQGAWNMINKVKEKYLIVM